jgi:hypothetical protein
VAELDGVCAGVVDADCVGLARERHPHVRVTRIRPGGLVG